MEIFLVIILLLISIIILIYFIGLNKLKNYRIKIDKTEEIISNALNEKQEIIIGLNINIKKATDKKDYLKDYLDLNNQKINNIEKDIKLDEANKLINDLKNDFSKLMKDNDFNKKLQSLREVNEKLISAKNIYNANASLNNKLIKIIPYNIIAKIANYNIITLYNNSLNDEN